MFLSSPFSCVAGKMVFKAISSSLIILIVGSYKTSIPIIQDLERAGTTINIISIFPVGRLCSIFFKDVVIFFQKVFGNTGYFCTSVD